MAAMFVQSWYNGVDGIWVFGLGSEALAAVGLFFPFMRG
jgi:Na+-driven multidrug efflux pump